MWQRFDMPWEVPLILHVLSKIAVMTDDLSSKE